MSKWSAPVTLIPWVSEWANEWASEWVSLTGHRGASHLKNKHQGKQSSPLLTRFLRKCEESLYFPSACRFNKYQLDEIIWDVQVTKNKR